MSLKHTLLGFLNLNSMTGYELKKHMDKSTQFFWHAQLSQIYPTLKKLEQNGLVTIEIEPQDGKPDKKIYTITKKGNDKLLAWLIKPIVQLTPTKDFILLKLFFSGSLDKEIILQHLQNVLALQRQRLKQYQTHTKSYVEQIISETGLQTEGIMWESVRQFGEEYTQMYITWLEYTIKTVKETL